MVPVLLQEEARIPPDIDDLASFRRWAHSDEFPERGRFGYLAGELYVDLSLERLFAHNRVKTVFTAVLENLVSAADTGYVFSDGTLLTNVAADLSTEPDAMFVSYDAVREGRVTLVGEQDGDSVEIEGSPEMVLEIVSPTSVRKDTVTLPALYWTAGITEYWLVDVRGEARGQEPRFDIFRRGRSGWTATRKAAGWLGSRVFGRSFRLVRRTDPLGRTQYAPSLRP